MRLLLTWFDRIGANPQPNDEGPVLRLLRHGDAYDAALVLCTRATRGGARALAIHMRQKVPAVEVRALSINDPSDYSALFTQVSALIAELPAAQIDVLLSTGTPQSQTIWVLLVESGLLSARMLQVIPGRFVPHPHPHPVRVVDLNIEGFPEIRSLRAEVERLRGQTRLLAPGLIGESPPMRALAARLMKVAPSTLPVLIEGESGTGKELVARAIHEASGRQGPFVAFNCGTLSDALSLSELFGHRKGAFTGADRDHRGLFDVAQGGTLFFDEIAELSPRVQVQLLRALQEQRIRPVGATDEVSVDVRIVGATHAKLNDKVDDGSFRADLFYRLQGAVLPVPALRDRLGDIGLLVSHFMKNSAPDRRLSHAAWQQLHAHAWPGNVRELRTCIERALVFGGSTLDAADLGLLPTPAPETPAPIPTHIPEATSLRAAVEATEKRVISAALSAQNGNLARTARALGIDRNTLKRKLAKHALRA